MDEQRFARHCAALGGEFRRRREALGWSQESFAAQVGVHRTYLGAIERGERNPSFRNLLRLADGLGCQLSEILSACDVSESAQPKHRVNV